MGWAVAVAALADKLLASPRYGEKWARHWLDVARYSDSNGYKKNLPRKMGAYRDGVIAALNRDLPYDRVLVEQIAGDLLPNATPDQVVATGFLRSGGDARLPCAAEPGRDPDQELTTKHTKDTK